MRAPTTTQGERIRRRRMELGFTLETLAKRVGVTKGVVSQWELDRVKEIKEANLRSLCEVLRVTQDYIARGIEIVPLPTLPSAEEVELLECYRAIPNELRPHVIRVVAALGRKNHP
jgi:transcriptional regulator with XRE-family HTH domain